MFSQGFQPPLTIFLNKKIIGEFQLMYKLFISFHESYEGHSMFYLFVLGITP